MDRRVQDLIESAASGSESRLTRRALLRALGLGGAAVATAMMAGGALPSAREAAAQEEVAVDPEIEDLAFALNLDVETIFRFVADEVRYDEYPGVLRGAKGTLWGLAGNSADQALLLADLLRAALVDVRFVTGLLTSEAAIALITSLTETEAATAREHAARILAVPPSETSPGDPAALMPAVQTLLNEFPARRQAFSELAATRLADGVKTIEESLASIGVTQAAPYPDLRWRERTRHVWLQYRSGTDWIDLDPSIPNAEAGAVYATPDETSDRLPDDVYHLVGIRVVSEVIQARQPARQELLAYQGRSQDLVGVPITLIHAAPEALEQFGVTLAAQFGGLRQWIPHVVVGHEVIAGTPMTFKSDATTTDVLGEASGAEGDTLAAWLVIDIISPDGETRTVERTIFDRVGPEHRAAGDLDPVTLPQIEVTTVEEFGEVYLPLLATANIAVVGGAVPGAHFVRDLAAEGASAQLAVMNHGYHYVRQALAAELVESNALRLFPSAPNVTVLTLAPTQLDGDAGRLTASIDIVHQSYDSAWIDNVIPTISPSIISGVLGHVAERAVLGEPAGYPADLPAPHFVSVGRIFEEAQRTGVAIRVLQPETTPADVDLPAAALAQIGELLYAGWIVIVPERAVSIDETEAIGWWQVHPYNGDTYDQIAGGGSSETVEYEAGIGQILALIFRLQKLAACIGGVAAALIGGVLLAIGEASINDPGVAFGIGSLPYTGAMCLVSAIH